MKLLFTLLVPVLISVSSFAQSKVNWMSWNEAVTASTESPKMIFVDTYTDWCGWCKKMDASTFSDPVISKYMNENYYSVKMDAEMKDTIDFNGYQFVNPNPNGRRSTHQLAASLLDNKLSYPSFVILTPKFERMQILPGYKSAKDFEPIIRYFVEGASQGVEFTEYMKGFSSLYTQI